jgi:hypothetical protein
MPVEFTIPRPKTAAVLEPQHERLKLLVASKRNGSKLGCVPGVVVVSSQNEASPEPGTVVSGLRTAVM